MGKVLLVLDPHEGVSEVRLIPDAHTRFEDQDLFRYAGKLWSIIMALDESLLFNPLLRRSERKNGEDAGSPVPSGEGR